MNRTVIVEVSAAYFLSHPTIHTDFSFALNDDNYAEVIRVRVELDAARAVLKRFRAVEHRVSTPILSQFLVLAALESENVDVSTTDEDFPLRLGRDAADARGAKEHGGIAS